MRRKGILLHSWDCKLVLPLWRIVERFLIKLKIGSSTSLEQTQMWSFLWLSDIPLMMQGAQTWCSVTTWRGRMDYLKGWKSGERFKTEETQVCLWVTHVDVWQKPTQHCKAIILQLKKKNHLNIQLPYDPAISLLGIYPEKNMVQKEKCTQTSLQHCLQQQRHGSNLNVRWHRNG